MKVLLIFHQKAGGGATSGKAIAELLSDAGWKVRRLSRREADAKAIRSVEADLVAIAGGDGTVAEVLTCLPDRTVPVAIIPTGTANNIAASLGIEGEPEAVVSRWDMDRRLRFDIGEALCPWGRTPFAEGVGFGAFADSLRLARDADRAEKLRAGREAMAEALRESAILPLEFTLDGAPLRGEWLLCEVLNIALSGPRLPLAPDADAGDGRLHLSLLGEDGRQAMIAWLKAGGTTDLPVDQRSGREVVVRGGGVMMRIDDRCCWLEPKSEVTIRLQDEPVRILAPPGGPALAG